GRHGSRGRQPHLLAPLAGEAPPLATSRRARSRPGRPGTAGDQPVPAPLRPLRPPDRPHRTQPGPAVRDVEQSRARLAALYGGGARGTPGEGHQAGSDHPVARGALHGRAAGPAGPGADARRGRGDLGEAGGPLPFRHRARAPRRRFTRAGVGREARSRRLHRRAAGGVGPGEHRRYTLALMFQVIPAVDVQRGKAVRLYEGDPAKETVYFEDPVAAARHRASPGAGLLHLVDLDATLGSGTNAAVIERIAAEVGVPLELGGGIRSAADAERWLAVVDRVVLGTAAVARPELVSELVERHGPDRVCVSVDARAGKVAVK